MEKVFQRIVQTQFNKRTKRNIWADSKWKQISELDTDDVGKIGELALKRWCSRAKIPVDIDGAKTKCYNGVFLGDGTINGRSVEIKTARIGSTTKSFQHELGENPWETEFMVFIDIAPKEMYITIFPNFSKRFYKNSGVDSKIKCTPYFPTKSICWRKKRGAFKLDTNVGINKQSKNTFTVNPKILNFRDFKKFVNKVIPPQVTQSETEAI